MQYSTHDSNHHHPLITSPSPKSMDDSSDFLLFNLPVPKLDRTLTDVLEDELYTHTSNTPSQGSIKEVSPPPSHSSGAASLLSSSRSTASQQAQSPFRTTSPFYRSSVQEEQPLFAQAQQKQPPPKVEQQQPQLLSAQAAQRPQYLSPKDALLPSPVTPLMNVIEDGDDDDDDEDDMYSSDLYSGAHMFPPIPDWDGEQTTKPDYVYSPFVEDDTDHQEIVSLINQQQQLQQQQQQQQTASPQPQFTLAPAAPMNEVPGLLPDGGSDKENELSRSYETEDIRMEEPDDSSYSENESLATSSGGESSKPSSHYCRECKERYEGSSTAHRRQNHHEMNGHTRSETPVKRGRQHHSQVASLHGTVTSASGPHRCTIINPTTGLPCNKVFSRPYDLIRHQETIHSKNRKTFKCPICRDASKTFSRQDAVSRHIRVKHGG